MTKLKTCVIGNIVLSLLDSYLRGTESVVKFSGGESNPFQVKSSVPQFILGAHLVNVFLRDIKYAMDAIFHQFTYWLSKSRKGFTLKAPSHPIIISTVTASKPQDCLLKDWFTF